MTHDVHEPLSYYRDLLKETHARNTSEYFEGLVARAGTDGVANAESVARINALASEINSVENRISRTKLLRGGLIAAAVILLLAGVGLIYFHFSSSPSSIPPAALALAVAALPVSLVLFMLSAKKLTPRITELSAQLMESQARHNEEKDQAWRQMERLNTLFEWDTIAKLVEKSLPNLTLDPYCDNARLDELRSSFGWDDSFNHDRSVLCAQSGAINGNPFLLAETLNFEMSTATYTGSLSISWQERERDSEGRVRWVTRHQTLYASVTKPAPAYSKNKFLIFGNEAAPDLCFTRKPTGLAQASGTLGGKFRKWSARRKIEAFARNLDDESNFTLMANREFETLFNAVDRNHEVQFRLLFTPLAQQQMVKLLKDREVGYGDNFTFIKSHMINMIFPDHLTGVDLSAAPELFHHYDLRAVRARFNEYSNAFFNALYFALAPLFTIPLYQQHRSHGDIYKDIYAMRPSFWEQESLANYYGEEIFKHPQSVTTNILKTTEADHAAGEGRVEVTAHGFRGRDRVDYIPKLGGDGRMHNVPVHWTEYLPVQRTSSMAVRRALHATQADYAQELATSDAWRDLLQLDGGKGGKVSLRRSLISILLN